MNARDYLALLRERKLLIGACVVACVVVATIVTFLTPKQYASSVDFYVVASSSSGQGGASDNYQGAQLSTERVKSYTELLTGPRVAADAAVKLGAGTTAGEVMDAVSATSVAETVIITLTAKDTSPARAEAIAGAVSASFTTLIRQLESVNAGVRPSPPVPIDSSTGSPAQAPAVTAQVLQPPSDPGSPVSPSLQLNLALGLIVGLLLGFGAAVTRHALDTRVTTAEELRDAAGAAVLGSVPEVKDTAHHPVSLTADPTTDGTTDARTGAYQRIRTSLEVVGGGRSRVLVVTSALPGEGRTTTACNLAAALSAVGARVVLVEGDLRNPTMADQLGLDESAGLTGVLTGKASLPQALQRWSPERLAVLTSGPAVPRPNELLASRRTRNLLAELRSGYDYVIVDAPAVLTFADAANLATYADGVLLVCRWGSTNRPQVESTVTFLRSVSVPVLGAILTRVPATRRATATSHAAAPMPHFPPAVEIPRPSPVPRRLIDVPANPAAARDAMYGASSDTEVSKQVPPLDTAGEPDRIRPRQSQGAK